MVSVDVLLVKWCITWSTFNYSEVCFDCNMNKTSVSSPIFVKSRARLYRGHFYLNTGIHLTEVLA